MNLMRIEVYQNGRKVGALHRTSQEELEAIRDMNDLNMAISLPHYFPEKIGTGFNSKLVATLLLIDPDDDGHPEIVDSKIVSPLWDEHDTALVRQGYLLALKEIRNECLFPLDSDAHKIHELHRIIHHAEQAAAGEQAITLNPNIII